MKLNLGRSTAPDPPAATADPLARRRVQAARHCRIWRELDPIDLVPRDGGYYVHHETDECWRVYSGDAFSRSATIVDSTKPLAFVVVNGDVLMLEPQARTWSAHVARQAGAR